MEKYRSIWLIVSSLTLLSIFEILWLRKVWQEQYDALQQETELVFQRTVATLQDSLVSRNMRRHNIAPDAQMLPRTPQAWQMKTPHAAIPPPPPIAFETSANMILRLENKGDKLQPDTFRLDQVQVYIATTDSHKAMPRSGVDRLLLNLPEQIRKMNNKEQFFRIEKDTISNAELERNYRRALEASGIPLPFRLYQADSLPLLFDASGIATQPAFAGLLTHRFYAAHFRDYRMHLLRKMLPSLAFALLLFGITAAAFILIYRSLRHQQRLSQLKNEFISNITHELKTPITTVGVALEALSDFQAISDPEKTREYLTLSKLELDRLSLLVDKVLRLSMFEETEPHLQPEPLDLGALALQVAAAMALQAERAGARIRADGLKQHEFMVLGDRLHLSSVIFNLLDNALKYTSGTPDIHIAMEKTPEIVRLCVRDNGIGIPPDYQDKVFEKFFRVPSGDTHNVKGHGLGLSYVSKVVRQHGGDIRLESTPGQGSAFVVELPAIKLPAAHSNFVGSDQTF